MSSGVELSVVIPFRDAAPHLGLQLEALARQHYDGEWEVVLVDNGSRDGSRKIAESFAGKLRLRVVDASERAGAAYATNVGVRQALGRKLLFVDADDEIEPGYVAAMGAALDQHDFVTSSFDHRALNPPWVQAAHGVGWRDPNDPLPVHFDFLPVAGAGTGVVRSVFESVGGYPEEFPFLYDIALSWELQLRGTTLHHVPQAIYRVRYRSTLPGLFRQAYGWASCSPLLYRRYRQAGMKGKTAGEWLNGLAGTLWQLFRARNRTDLAPLVLGLGYGAGVLRGSLRYRTLFFGAPLRPDDGMDARAADVPSRPGR
jgi:glycosyltransferase involved in cell wall biosynthesis